MATQKATMKQQPASSNGWQNSDTGHESVTFQHSHNKRKQTKEKSKSRSNSPHAKRNGGRGKGYFEDVIPSPGVFSQGSLRLHRHWLLRNKRNRRSPQRSHSSSPVKRTQAKKKSNIQVHESLSSKSDLKPARNSAGAAQLHNIRSSRKQATGAHTNSKAVHLTTSADAMCIKYPSGRKTAQKPPTTSHSQWNLLDFGGSKQGFSASSQQDSTDKCITTFSSLKYPWNGSFSHSPMTRSKEPLKLSCRSSTNHQYQSNGLENDDSAHTSPFVYYGTQMASPTSGELLLELCAMIDFLAPKSSPTAAELLLRLCTRTETQYGNFENTLAAHSSHSLLSDSHEPKTDCDMLQVETTGPWKDPMNSPNDDGTNEAKDSHACDNSRSSADTNREVLRVDTLVYSSGSPVHEYQLSCSPYSLDESRLNFQFERKVDEELEESDQGLENFEETDPLTTAVTASVGKPKSRYLAAATHVAEKDVGENQNIGGDSQPELADAERTIWNTHLTTEDRKRSTTSDSCTEEGVSVMEDEKEVSACNLIVDSHAGVGTLENISDDDTKINVPEAEKSSIADTLENSTDDYSANTNNLNHSNKQHHVLDGDSINGEDKREMHIEVSRVGSPTDVRVQLKELDNLNETMSEHILSKENDVDNDDRESPSNLSDGDEDCTSTIVEFKELRPQKELAYNSRSGKSIETNINNDLEVQFFVSGHDKSLRSDNHGRGSSQFMRREPETWASANDTEAQSGILANSGSADTVKFHCPVYSNNPPPALFDKSEKKVGSLPEDHTGISQPTPKGKRLLVRIPSINGSFQLLEDQKFKRCVLKGWLKSRPSGSLSSIFGWTTCFGRIVIGTKVQRVLARNDTGFSLDEVVTGAWLLFYDKKK